MPAHAKQYCQSLISKAMAENSEVWNHVTCYGFHRQSCCLRNSRGPYATQHSLDMCRKLRKLTCSKVLEETYWQLLGVSESAYVQYVHLQGVHTLHPSNVQHLCAWVYAYIVFTHNVQWTYSLCPLKLYKSRSAHLFTQTLVHNFSVTKPFVCMSANGCVDAWVMPTKAMHAIFLNFHRLHWLYKSSPFGLKTWTPQVLNTDWFFFEGAEDYMQHFSEDKTACLPHPVLYCWSLSKVL